MSASGIRACTCTHPRARLQHAELLQARSPSDEPRPADAARLVALEADARRAVTASMEVALPATSEEQLGEAAGVAREREDEVGGRGAWRLRCMACIACLACLACVCNQPAFVGVIPGDNLHVHIRLLNLRQGVRPLSQLRQPRTQIRPKCTAQPT